MLGVQETFGRTRVSKEGLAREVRKNFVAQPVVEGEVVVRFLYSVKMQDRCFRMRFPPGRKMGGGAALSATGGGGGSNAGGNTAE